MRYPQVSLGAAVVMPNHFHGIVNIHEIRVRVIHTLTGTRELPQRGNTRVQRRRAQAIRIGKG